MVKITKELRRAIGGGVASSTMPPVAAKHNRKSAWLLVTHLGAPSESGSATSIVACSKEWSALSCTAERAHSGGAGDVCKNI